MLSLILHFFTYNHMFLSEACKDFSLTCQVQKTQSWKEIRQEMSMLEEDAANGSGNFPILERTLQHREDIEKLWFHAPG